MGILAVAFIVFALFLGILLLQKYESRRAQPTVPPVPQQAGTVTVSLFFAAPDSSALVREGREIDACDTPAECMEEVVDELINGPLGELGATLPPIGTIRGVSLEGDLARVDLGRELVEALPAGSNSELLAAYSIVDSLCFNFPQVRRVLFTVDGEKAQTLKGHLDLRAPLAPDFSLESGAKTREQGETR